jgi:hypothetical protein
MRRNETDNAHMEISASSGPKWKIGEVTPRSADSPAQFYAHLPPGERAMMLDAGLYTAPAVPYDTAAGGPDVRALDGVARLAAASDLIISAVTASNIPSSVASSPKATGTRRGHRARSGATAAPTGPPEAEFDFSPRGSFSWDENTADKVRKQSTMFNLRRSIAEAKEGSSGLKTNLIDEDGSEIMMIKHAGSDLVTVARPGEPPQMIGVDVVRNMQKSVLLPFGKDGIPTPLPRGFMPGATEGQMQARGFEKDGRIHARVR